MQRPCMGLPSHRIPDYSSMQIATFCPWPRHDSSVAWHELVGARPLILALTYRS